MLLIELSGLGEEGGNGWLEGVKPFRGRVEEVEGDHYRAGAVLTKPFHPHAAPHPESLQRDLSVPDQS